MIGSLLIANRGEIAVRIIRTCRDMGIRTVAVYSVADAGSRHVDMADDAVCIGGAPSAESYLNISNIITAACAKRCDAIHPGVGFLSENPVFVDAVEQSGLIFIGPDSRTVLLLGDKVQARNTAMQAGIPVIPGSNEPIQDIEMALGMAKQIGYPVMLKATAGGGGRGIRVVESPDGLRKAFEIATREAQSFFSNGTLFLEKYLAHPRHVEMQMLADGKGAVVCLGDRDCSVQQNHQKLIEESPSEAIDDDLRKRMEADCIRLFTKIGYRGAGTVEFLVQDGTYCFMEVNARVQVEHPVTEAVSSIDIIRQQILIASGKNLSLGKEPLQNRGHALECRINATCAGSVTRLDLPLGPAVRVDTHLFRGAVISPYYDHLMAKIIVHTPDRPTSLATMSRALRECCIEGVGTNIGELQTILGSSQFRSGRFSTDLHARLCMDHKGGTP
ncbi:MAG: acetyl/propionyl/methylcrotonyl-CoA carboxylase subunit alpha [Sphaerochaetaceae bacterium]